MQRAYLSLRGLLEHHQHLVKYFIIGGVASGIDVVLFLVLFNVAGFSALISHSISVPTSVLFSFLVNARHNFHTSDYMWLRLLSFAIVAVIGYAAGYGVIEASVFAGLGANIGKFLSLPVVFVIQYLLNSRITFRKVTGTGDSQMENVAR
jgi:putative flippase GtrA